MKFAEVNDPKNLCKNVAGLGRWGNGEVQVHLRSAAELDDVTALVRQSLDKHLDNGED